MLEKLKNPHEANIHIRKDGNNFYFEADWLYNMEANEIIGEIK